MHRLFFIYSLQRHPFPVIVMTLLFTYLSYYGPVTDWGDISNELIFHQVRKYLLRMEQGPSTPSKFWKPNLLLFVNDCDVGVLALCNTLKKGGLLVVSQVVTGSIEDAAPIAQRLRVLWTAFLRSARLKAFVHTTTAVDVRQAYVVRFWEWERRPKKKAEVCGRI